jgi:hypothetical protein
VKYGYTHEEIRSLPLPAVRVLLGDPRKEGTQISVPQLMRMLGK